VTTSVGIQGLAEARTCIGVADEPEQFAREVADILQNPEAAIERCLRGLDFIERDFSQDAFRRIFGVAVPELLTKRSV
jgi:hypothetical protein